VKGIKMLLIWVFVGMAYDAVADDYIYDPRTGEIVARGVDRPNFFGGPDTRDYYDPRTGEHVYSSGSNKSVFGELGVFGDNSGDESGNVFSWD